MTKSKISYLIILLFILFIQIDAQNVRRNQISENTPQPFFKLKVNKAKSLPITLQTKNVSVAEITEKLSQYYNISFALSRTVTNYKPAIDIPSGTLETVLRQLAPFVILEKELTGANAPIIKGVYLYAYNESVPAMKDGRSLSNIQSFIFEGNTETDTDGKEDDQLIIRYKDGKLSVRCKNQPLILVAGKIAEQLGTPFTVLKNSAKNIDLDFSNLSVEQAFRYFPNNVVLKYQVFLSSNQTVFNQIIVQ